jgi:glycosyltransferase involved in cell wall biosynthesis
VFRDHQPTGLKARLGISQRRKVLIMVGRLSREKNHDFALGCMAELAQAGQPPCLLVVGSGPELARVQQKVGELNLSKHVVMLGERTDVAALMLEVADAFILPSLTEGSPLTVIEARAAGLPGVVSASVPAAATAGAHGLVQMAATSSCADWVAQIRNAIDRARAPNEWQGLSGGSYDINSNAQILARLYRGESLV